MALKKENYKKLKETYDKLHEQYPRWSGLENIEHKIQITFEDLLRKADSKYHDKNYVAALPFLENALILNPRDTGVSDKIFEIKQKKSKSNLSRWKKLVVILMWVFGIVGVLIISYVLSMKYVLPFGDSDMSTRTKAIPEASVTHKPKKTPINFVAPSATNDFSNQQVITESPTHLESVLTPTNFVASSVTDIFSTSTPILISAYPRAVPRRGTLLFSSPVSKETIGPLLPNDEVYICGSYHQPDIRMYLTGMGGCAEADILGWIPATKVDLVLDSINLPLPAITSLDRANIGFYDKNGLLVNNPLPHDINIFLCKFPSEAINNRKLISFSYKDDCATLAGFINYEQVALIIEPVRSSYPTPTVTPTPTATPSQTQDVNVDITSTRIP